MASADILIKSDTYWSSVNCFAMLELPYEERCEFVHRAKRCEHSMNLVPYLELLACRFRCRNQFEELVYIALLLFFSSELIICLGYVLHYYFMPMLRTVAKMLHMNDHLAGVTIIALGNTLPKLFVNWSGRELKTLVASQLSQRFSLFLFVAMFSGGLICYMRPLRMNSHRTIRDLLFFIYGLTLMEYISINDGTISFPEYLLLIFVYCFYLTVNVLDLYMQHISMKSLRRQIQAQTTNVQVIQEKYYILVQDLRVCTPCRSYTNSICHEFQNIQKEPCLGLRFCKLKDWQRANALIRAFYIARAPIVWLCMIYIPLVDCERAGHGWRKLLNSMQICLNPALTIALMFRDTSMWSLYVLYSLMLTLPLCLFVLVRSDARVAPKYHSIFVILNLIGCLFIIHHLVKEISLILELIGTLRHMSDYFIDVTVAPIASGLTDLVTSFSLCKQGYERMAYAAAIGGTFLNIILGKDGSLITAIIIYGINPNAKLINIYCENAFILLIIGLLSMLLLISLFKFNVQRSLGIYSMSIYLLYLLFTTLVMKWTFHTFKISFSFNTQGSSS